MHICRPLYKIMDSKNYIMHAHDLRAGWQYYPNIRIVKTKNDHGHSTSNLAIPVEFGRKGVERKCVVQDEPGKRRFRGLTFVKPLQPACHATPGPLSSAC